MLSKKSKGILLSVITVSVIVSMLGTATMSYLSDTETSFSNTIAAGIIDLKIDCKSTHSYDGNVQQTITIEEKDLVFGDTFFNWQDVKPGDNGEATLSFHVYDNDAWLWFQACNVIASGGAHPEPEQHIDPNNECDLDENINVRIWWDDGDNTYEPEESETLLWPTTGDWGTAAEALQWLTAGALGPYEMTACTTYYIGIEWNIPTNVGNEIQGDSLTFDLSFYAEQTRNNPNPIGPGSLCDDPFQEECYLQSIDLRVLDGLAGQTVANANDDFEVYIDGNLVYTHTGTGATNSGETWITHGPINIGYLGLESDVSHVIKIDCISQAQWSSFATYGQLGVDWIKVTTSCGDEHTIDLGGNAEPAWASLTLIGWGPSEPGINGGNWGGFGTSGEYCRVTWEPAGSSDATITFTLP